MPHDFDEGLETLIATGWYRIHPAVIVTLGDGVTTAKYSTVNIQVGSDTFVDRLKFVGSAKMSLTSAVDRVPLELWNADSQGGLAFIDPVEALDGAKASYYQIYVNPSDADEKYLVEEISGVLKVDPNAGANDETVETTLVSDTAALPSIAGNLPILPDCANRYRDGVAPGLGACDYDGELPTCDMTFDGGNGCAVHFTFEEALVRFGGHSLNLDRGTVDQLTNDNQRQDLIIRIEELQDRYRNNDLILKRDAFDLLELQIY